MNGAHPVRRGMPFGAELLPRGGVSFRLWAPSVRKLELELIDPEGARQRVPMTAQDDGWYATVTDRASAGTLYSYRVDDRQDVPDPASRFQPRGVHGPSQVVDPFGYSWRVDGWRGRPWHEAVVYEMHIGAFTAEGTFRAAAARFGELAGLGVTAIEIMPVAAFPGHRNWGYDGVLPFAPFAGYGSPDDLRALVDTAHEAGLMVLLDVVYNHFGPEGNYLHLYAESFFTNRHQTPWGAAINFDGAQSRPVREFFIHNALYWLDEFRMDGLRLDAVHAIKDDSHPDVLEELAATVYDGPGSERAVHLVLENERNEARYLHSGRGFHAYTAQWNDDFHHACHVLLTGEHDGYYSDYRVHPEAHLARCLAEGFAYQGEPSRYRGGARRGEPSAGVRCSAFIDFLQSHDQIGNRAQGERLAALVSAAPLRAAVSVMLLAPATPALFMGEEFGCTEPFLFFTDFEGELAAAVRRGRQEEFIRFRSFSADSAQAPIPDPNDPATFERSKLRWSVIGDSEHAAWLELYRELLSIRHREITPRVSGTAAEAWERLAPGAIAVRWRMGDGSRLSLIANLSNEAQRAEHARHLAGEVLYEIGWHDVQRSRADALPPWSVGWYLTQKAQVTG
jgi:maltooligosyltrehalose trehalohydrolase